MDLFGGVLFLLMGGPASCSGDSHTHARYDHTRHNRFAIMPSEGIYKWVLRYVFGTRKSRRAKWSPAMFPGLNEHRDIVLIDQRGTSGSNAVVEALQRAGHAAARAARPYQRARGDIGAAPPGMPDRWDEHGATLDHERNLILADRHIIRLRVDRGSSSRRVHTTL